jgi:hypothetical protein
MVGIRLAERTLEWSGDLLRNGSMEDFDSIHEVEEIGTLFGRARSVLIGYSGVDPDEGGSVAMAAGVLPSPGSVYGPCEGCCIHVDCIRARAMAETACRVCSERIGYERTFYRENPDSLVHELCLFEEIREEVEE